MRAISLWQPWASAVALGLKTIETRSWSTAYRGPLVIQAAAFRGAEARTAFYEKFFMDFRKKGVRDFVDLPLGALVVRCDLVDCVPTSAVRSGLSDLELRFGNYDHGIDERSSIRWYAWILKNIQPLPKPVPYKGKQGFFNVEPEVLRACA